MKKLYTLLLGCIFTATFTNCNDFLDYTPTAVVDEDKAFSEPEKMVNAAYAMLGDCWFTYPFNLFPYGDISSDDCLKGGSGTTDTGYHAFDIWTTLTPTTPGEIDELWYRLYCAISRCNRAILSLEQYGDKLGKDTKEQRIAEMKFLRGHFYFKLITVFRQVPWIDEEVAKDQSYEQVSNNELTYEELFGKVIDDFKDAYDILPVKKPGEDARANKIAAASYLAKCYLTLAWGDGYEATTGESYINSKYMQKVIDYTDDVIASDYNYLEDFGDIFLPSYKNSKESVFAVQCSDYQADNTTFGRANWSNTLNGCWQMWSCGWDFHKPSQNLVNAFKTQNGLPMFDSYNNKIDYPIYGNNDNQKWDPRLFHTVGMPTYPYKYESKYMMTTANSRNPNTYGYYTSLKEVPQRSAGETYNGSWQAFAMNDYVFRYTDVMLMRAEALIELNNLPEALQIINDIRKRASHSIDKHIAYAKDQCEIALYPENYFKDKAVARKCLRWERRLEMAMENGRFFDLRRWGIASKTLNSYFATEQNSVYTFKNEKGETIEQNYGQYYKDAHFTAEKNEYFPIPYNQIFYIPGLYTQNKGYK